MDVFQKTKEDVIGKVRKLLAQAEDPAATPEEAEAFTEKAQQLMSKYSISLAMVSDAGKAHQLVEKGWLVHKPYARHKVTLINAVARANDCKALYDDRIGGGRMYIQVVGYPSDVDWVETLYASLDVQLAGALSAAIRNKPADVHGRTFSVGFVAGFIAGVAERLQKARREAIVAAETARQEEEDARREATRFALDRALEPTPAAGPSVALVLVAKMERVEEEFKIRHPGTRSVRRYVRLQSWSGYNPGRAAGNRATLARGSVGTSRRPLSA